MHYHLISDSSEDICEGQPIFSRQLHICIEHPETYEVVEKEGVLEVLTVWQYLQEHPISDSATCRKPQMRDTYIFIGCSSTQNAEPHNPILIIHKLLQIFQIQTVSQHGNIP